ncbi:MAG: DUF5615 family PIN-like protein [Pyrinomonadaceae bacterium]
MIQFLTDEHFKSAIYAGVKRRLPVLDIVRVQDVGLRTASDPRILQFAALEDRIILSHDVHTMETFAKARLNAGKPMAGLLLIRQSFPIGAAIDEIVFIAECSRDDEWNGAIRYLPL